MNLTSVERWKEVDAPVKGVAGARSWPVLRAVSAQFDVEGNPRYTPGKPGITWCNIFSWDVTRALGCEIPHWLPATEDKPRHELTANMTSMWLDVYGRTVGWRNVNEIEAGRRAAAGFPTVAIYRNDKPGGHGHIALLLPPRAGELRIAQAGRKCLFDVPLRDGFGAVQPIRFFTHD